MSIGYEIVRLRLKGFKHFTSIGLEDFEINRYGSKNNIILLLGENGSGKSLLCSAWTPYANESTSNRKRPLVDNGIKEIDILTTDIETGEHGEFLYKLKIIYSETSTNCSLIRVDRLTGESEELNPNGLVRSYEAKIEELFGISQDYKNIGFLSSQVSSIVKMSPATRYEYISSFLPNIENYLEYYKIVFKRMNSINRQVKMLETDIGDISIENVNMEKNLLTVKIDDVKKRIEELKEHRIKLTFIHENLANVSGEFIRETINTINKNKRTLDSSYERLMTLSTESRKYLGEDGKIKLINDINTCSSRMEVVNNKLSEISRSIDEKRIRLKDLEYNLGMLGDTGDTLPDISSMVERLENSLVESSKILESYRNNYEFLNEIPTSMTINEFNIVSNLVNNIRERYEKITNLIPLDKVDNISEYSDINDKQLRQLLNKIKDVETRISKTLERISLIKNSPLDSSILNLVPDFCDTGKCGVIREIHKLLSPDTEVEKLNDVLKSLYDEKSDLSQEVDNLSDDSGSITIAISFIGDINHYLMRDKQYVSMLPDHLRDILSGTISNIFSNLNGVMKNIETMREYVSLRDQLNLYTTELRGLKEKESSLKVKLNMNSDIMNINNSIDDMITERIEYHREGEILLERDKTLNDLKESIDVISNDIEEYNSMVKSHIEISDKMKKICKDWYYREKISRVLSKIEIDYRNLSFELNSYNGKLESLNNLIVTKQSLIDMRDRLLTTSKELEILRDAWDPKTGIPSLFINNFLTRIHVKSNEYLGLLNGNELRISKFEIGKTAREFPIIIQKIDGAIVPDSSQCSDGQIALLTLSISMAMIHEAVREGGYNILRLDELDSVLDSTRKKLFIEMIQDRLKEINSAQCVIITHNDEFNNVPADVILLPGSHATPDLLWNKNVLLDASNLSLEEESGE